MVQGAYPPDRPTARDIARRVTGSVYHGNVGGLFVATGRMLDRAGCLYRTHVSRGIAPGYTVDFLCEGGVAVKMSIGCSVGSLEQQLLEYARGEDVAELLLITAVLGHAACLAGRSHIRSKPLSVARFTWCVHP